MKGIYFFSKCRKNEILNLSKGSFIFQKIFSLTDLSRPVILRNHGEDSLKDGSKDLGRIVSKTLSKTVINDAKGFIESWKKFNQNNSSEISSKNVEETSSNLPSLSFSSIDWPSIQENFRKEFITYVEVFWFVEKRLPTRDECFQKFGDFDWEDTILNVSESLQNRGIRPYDTPVGYLEPHFVFAVNLLLSVYDRRSVPAKLKEAGLTTKQWTAFLRSPEHHKYYKDRLDEIFDQDAQNDAKLKLHELIAQGDLQAIKYYNEQMNIYRPASEDNNKLILQTLQLIIDIVAIHVSPDVLSKIANDLSKNSILTESKELPNALSS